MRWVLHDASSGSPLCEICAKQDRLFNRFGFVLNWFEELKERAPMPWPPLIEPSNPRKLSDSPNCFNPHPPVV